MPRIDPLPRESLPEYEHVFSDIEARMGFLPNSMLTMARRPDVMEAFSRLHTAVMGDGKVDGVLKQLVATVVSAAAGCSYCQAHTSHVAERRGTEAEKLASVWQFETSPLFSEAERAALRVAQGAGVTPNAVTDEQMAQLGRHFDDDQVVEIVAVIANFGFLNRWNDTLATQLERTPLGWATEHLGDNGWAPGKHA
jgi:uncharacterized peroxidase-related enzyme